MNYKIIFDNDILFFFFFQNSSSWTLANTTGVFIGKQRLHILGNSDAHYFRLFGKLENKNKKKEVKMPSDQVSSQLNVIIKHNTKNFNLPESPAVRSELESEPWRQVSKDDAFPRLFTSIYQRYNVSFLTTPCCNWQSSKLWKTCYLIKRRLQTKIKSGSLVGSYFEPPACFLQTRLPQLTLADVR